MKKQIVRLLFSATLYFIFCPSQSMENNHQNAYLDSLMNNAISLTGEKRESAFLMVADAAVNINSEKSLEIAGKLEEIGKEEDNNLLLGFAYAVRAFYYMKIYAPGQPDADKVDKCAEKAFKYFTKVGSHAIGYQTQCTVAEWHMTHGHPETALAKLHNLIENACQNKTRDAESTVYLSIAYVQQSIRQYGEAIAASEKAYETAQYMNPKDMEQAQNLALSHLSSNLQGIKDYGRIIKISKNLISRLEKRRDEIGSLYGIYVEYTNLANAYTNLRRNGEAKNALDSAAAIYKTHLKNMDDGGNNDFYLYYSYALYYRLTGDYGKALEYIDKSLLRVKDKFYNNAASDIAVMDTKSNTLADMGRYKEAFDLKSQIYQMSDSLNRVNAANRVDDLRTIYETDLLIAENEKRQTLIIASAVCSALLLIVALSLWIYSQKLKKKNKMLFERLKLTGKPEFLQPLTSRKNGTFSTDREDGLYQRILTYIETEKPYLDSSFSREKAAQDMGTNRQYLADSIKEGADMTFGEFVFFYRLEHAKEMLLRHPEMTIEGISIESGFNTLSTFYRRFKEQYGMSPVVFRSFVKKKEKSVH